MYDINIIPTSLTETSKNEIQVWGFDTLFDTLVLWQR